MSELRAATFDGRCHTCGKPAFNVWNRGALAGGVDDWIALCPDHATLSNPLHAETFTTPPADERGERADWRQLLVNAKNGLEWALDKQRLWECDCEPGYEYDTNATIHQDSCAVLLEGHLEATADWIRMALDADARPAESPDMPFAAYAHWQRKALWAEAQLGDAARLIGQLLRIANRSDDDRYRQASAWLKGYGAWLEDKADARPASTVPADERGERERAVIDAAREYRQYHIALHYSQVADAALDRLAQAVDALDADARPVQLPEGVGDREGHLRGCFVTASTSGGIVQPSGFILPGTVWICEVGCPVSAPAPEPPGGVGADPWAALEQYGDHEGSCAFYHMPDFDCDCGWVEWLIWLTHRPGAATEGVTMPIGQCTCCTQEDGPAVCGCESGRCRGCYKCPRHCVCTHPLTATTNIALEHLRVRHPGLFAPLVQLRIVLDAERMTDDLLIGQFNNLAIAVGARCCKVTDALNAATEPPDSLAAKRAFMALPLEERRRIMAEQAEAIAPEYERPDAEWRDLDTPAPEPPGGVGADPWAANSETGRYLCICGHGRLDHLEPSSDTPVCMACDVDQQMIDRACHPFTPYESHYVFLQALLAELDYLKARPGAAAGEVNTTPPTADGT